MLKIFFSFLLLPQLLASPVAWALAALAAERMPHAYLGWVFVLAQGAVAVAIARVRKLPVWWQSIHLFLPILTAVFLWLQIPPAVYLLFFAVLLLVYGIPGGMRAPLFFSGDALVATLAKQLLPLGSVKLLDLGCGIGTVLVGVHRLCPEAVLSGVERALLPYGCARFRAFLVGRSQIQIQYGDFWDLSWREYDAVFAFLSPEPMAAVWFKACSEMKPGSWLYSYRFFVPGLEPQVRIKDRKGRDLYGWQVFAENCRPVTL